MRAHRHDDCRGRWHRDRRAGRRHARAADCAAIVQTALERFGRLDRLDNNVGIGSRGTVLDETEEHWRRVMQVNVDSMFLMARQVIPAMRRQAAAPSSTCRRSRRPPARALTAYTVPRRGDRTATRALAVDHGREHIRVNCVAPGPVYTPMVAAGGMSAAARDRRRQASVLGLEGTGWDVGHAVRFLLSDYARYITGHTLVVDGAPRSPHPSATPPSEAGRLPLVQVCMR